MTGRDLTEVLPQTRADTRPQPRTSDTVSAGNTPPVSAGNTPPAGNTPLGGAWRVAGPILRLAAPLVLITALVPLRDWWAAQFLLCLLLLTVPGLLALRALRVDRTATAAFGVYIPAASVVVLMMSGLLADLGGPLIGVDQPLRTGPLLIAVELICGILLVAASTAVIRPPADRAAFDWAEPVRQGLDADSPRRTVLDQKRPSPEDLRETALDLTSPKNLKSPKILNLARSRSAHFTTQLDWTTAVPLLAPVLAGAGALELNNGHGPALAIVALVASGALLVWGVVRGPRLTPVTLAMALFSIALAVTWAFSLRGVSVYGFDISTEYYGMEYTIQTGIWHVSHPGDAYGGLLSITVLPAELHALTGMSGLMLFKVLYPALNAFFPVAVFGLGQKVVSRRWAFAAAAFIVIQLPFSQEMPALARQEIALLLFAAMAGAMLDAAMPRYPRWALTAVFAMGMVVSHYSTTYFAIILLVPVLPLQWIVSRFRPDSRLTGLTRLSGMPGLSGATLVAVVVSVAGAVLWYGLLTHSAANVGQFAHAATTEGFDLLPNRSAGGNLVSSYLQGNATSTMSPVRYQQLIAQHYRQDAPYVHPLPGADAAQYALRPSVVPVTPARVPLLGSLVNLGDLVASQAAYLLAAIGVACLILRRSTPPLVRRYALLGASTILALVVIRLSGTVAASYNQQRAFVQSMAILSIAAFWSLESLSGWAGTAGRAGAAGWASRLPWPQRLRSPRRIPWPQRLRVRPRWLQLRTLVLAGAAAALVLIFVNSSGLASAVLGGSTDVNLSSGGEDYERFYVTAPEISSALWLGDQVSYGELVYADRYGQLRLALETGLTHGLMGDVTPQTLDRDAWVYASATNIVDHRARSDFQNDAVTYAYPIGFLNSNFNVVYTDGTSEVFHR